MGLDGLPGVTWNKLYFMTWNKLYFNQTGTFKKLFLLIFTK